MKTLVHIFFIPNVGTRNDHFYLVFGTVLKNMEILNVITT